MYKFTVYSSGMFSINKDLRKSLFVNILIKCSINLCITLLVSSRYYMARSL